MTESRRSHFRRNAFRFGTLRVGSGPEMRCLVWDRSETGAMIEVEAPDSVPDRVALAIDGSDRVRACSVARRDGLRLGLRFEDPAAAMPGAD